MVDFEIESLLQKTIGLKITTIGKSTLERSVKNRMRSLFLTDKNAYFQKLTSSSSELKALIEEVVIPETWFFRDREPFRAMTNFLVSNWAPNHRNGILRILSAPCSSGEEPYSLAITLFDSDWPAEKFTILGADISQRSITKAREGIYTEHSFRDVEPGYRANYFTRKNGGYVLDKTIRNKVHFKNGNILDQSFMEGLGLFDVIFFRNVLIYFDALSRHSAITTLYKMLADDGILFVGHAETTLFNNSPFRPAPYSQAFAFHKKNLLKTAKPPVLKNDSDINIPQKMVLNNELPSFRKTAKTIQPDLDVARNLADKGKLREATRICRAYIDQNGPSAQAFFLLGLISDVLDDLAQAEKLYRKALYLDPNHEETLIFLSLLTEKRGNGSEAKNIKQRIARLRATKAAGSAN
jgi:chemotaxis protein methyltransferase WspC